MDLMNLNTAGFRRTWAAAGDLMAETIGSLDTYWYQDPSDFDEALIGRLASLK